MAWRRCLGCGGLIPRGSRCRRCQGRRTNARFGLIRRAVRQRDGYRCRCCGAPESGRAHHVHHVRPITLGGVDSTTNLLTLCPACHAQADAR